MAVKKEFHPFRNLPLKWSFVFFVTICICTASLLSLVLSILFGTLSQSYPNEIYHILSIIVVPLSFIICIVIGSSLFYLKKLKKPLGILDNASLRIAKGNLDFNVEYESHNEFGHLAESFEKMRTSLYENNLEMWRITEEQRRLNAAFAHDLRTPLTVLQGYIDFLTKYIPEGKITTEKTLSTLSTMDDYLKRLTKFTETMSSLQKMSEMDLEYSEIDFGFLKVQLKDSIEIIAAGKNIHFHSNGSGSIFADNQAISEVFENLISNAVRYAKDNIKVMVCLDDGFLTITVTDDGKGFTKEALKNGSEPYFRDDNDSNHFGIGLYISKLLCEKHGGSLILENEQGGKVTVKFSVSEK